MNPTLPTARLDRITRLRVLTAGLPGTTVVETRIDAPFEEVWAWVSDLERSVPTFDGDVARLRILHREERPDGSERLRIRSTSTAAALGLPVSFDVDLAPGWCWMAGRPQLYVVGMAAEPDGATTRLALLEGLAFTLPRPLHPLAHPLLAASRWRHHRHIPHDLAAIRREFGPGDFGHR